MKIYRQQPLIRPDLQAHIYSQALLENVHNLKSLCPADTKFCAVVKANAYGHGIAEVVNILKKADVDFFAVASIYEAIHIAHMVKSRSILILEPLSQQYVRRLKRDSQLVRLDAPITLQVSEATHRSQLVKKGCLIIHSGNEVERKKLLQVAQKRMSENDDLFSVPDCIFPEQGIYPAERMIPRYKTIISAAGYNMVALASQAPPDQTYILHPFTRRFDNQFLRLRRF